MKRKPAKGTVMARERRKFESQTDRYLIRALRKLMPHKSPLKLSAFVMRLTAREKFMMLHNPKVQDHFDKSARRFFDV